MFSTSSQANTAAQLPSEAEGGVLKCSAGISAAIVCTRVTSMTLPVLAMVQLPRLCSLQLLEEQ